MEKSRRDFLLNSSKSVASFTAFSSLSSLSNFVHANSSLNSGEWSAEEIIHPPQLGKPGEFTTEKFLSRKAWGETNFNGFGYARTLEGQWPSDLNDEWIKIGPGRKKHYQTLLNHFFDGDAYWLRLQFQASGVSYQGQFIQTTQVKEELSAGKMIYSEFGTKAPGRLRVRRKNQPNINVIPWFGQWLVLSEGGHPALVNNKGDFVEWFDFSLSLPADVALGAHPKGDYFFGFQQGLSRAIKIYKFDRSRQRLEELYSLPQKEVPMLHDMCESDNFLFILLTPAYFDLSDLVLGLKPLSECLRFEAQKTSRLLILSKKSKQVQEVELPGGVCFHHAFAKEENTFIKLYSHRSSDDSLLKGLAQWQKPTGEKLIAPDLYETTLKILSSDKISLIGDKVIEKSCDFPVVKKTGYSQQLWVMNMQREEDPLAFSGVSYLAFEQGTSLEQTLEQIKRYEFRPFETAGEPKVLNEKWLALFGYSALKQESFVDILHSQTLQWQARAWLGQAFPIGFHGQ
jgi:all-trans-8'-apo-beta-carotenal 15,15'-oxygenase